MHFLSSIETLLLQGRLIALSKNDRGVGAKKRECLKDFQRNKNSSWFIVIKKRPS